jgi:DNA-binding NtrC family response regulator
MQIIQNYDWPGNVRELQNVIERSYYLANAPSIKPQDLPSFLLQNNATFKEKDYNDTPFHEAKEKIIEKFEQNYLKVQLDKNEWNISKTADSCGIDRRTIHRLINKYDLKR